MKFRLAALCLALLLVTTVAAPAQFIYGTNADGASITITNYTGPGGAVVVPSTINGLPVTAISDPDFDAYGAFGTNVGSVVIPDTVTDIRVGVFYKCYALSNVSFGANVGSIDFLAFGFCSNLTAITFPSSLTNIGSFAFPAAGLAQLNIPGTVATVGDYAFEMLTSLTNLNIGDGVASIGIEAFYDCSSLSYVVIPGSVTNVGGYAFNYCNLTNVTLAASTTNFGAGVVFDPCPNLESLTAPGDAILATYLYISELPGTWDFMQLTVANGSPSIGSEAFGYCYSLPNITIPASVTNIGAEAFEGCSVLTNITINGNAVVIGPNAFSNCPVLTRVYFTGSAPTLAPTAFAGDTNVTVYYLPGTTGWSSTIGGAPTVLWNPLGLSGSPAFGVVGNQFQISFTGPANLSVVLEGADNLASPAWIPLATNVLANGACNFNDPVPTNSPGRFYRITAP